MDDFAVELENNIRKNSKNKNGNDDKISPRFRDMFSIILSKSPKIEVSDKISPEGDIKFVVMRTDMGMSFEDLVKYRSEVFSSYCANFIGELLVRENINYFAKILVNLDQGNCSSVVDRYAHRKFGMEVIRDKFIFVFHISLLQSILTEDFKREVRLK